MANQTIPSNSRLILVKDCGKSINPPKRLKPTDDPRAILKDIEQDVKALQNLIEQVGTFQKNIYGKWRVLFETVKNLRRTLAE